MPASDTWHPSEALSALHLGIWSVARLVASSPNIVSRDIGNAPSGKPVEESQDTCCRVYFAACLETAGYLLCIASSLKHQQLRIPCSLRFCCPTYVFLSCLTFGIKTFCCFFFGQNLLRPCFLPLSSLLSRPSSVCENSVVCVFQLAFSINLPSIYSCCTHPTMAWYHSTADGHQPVHHLGRLSL